MLLDLRTTPENEAIMAWENVVRTSGMSASSAASGFPSSAARTYQTYEGWKPAGGTGTITSTFTQRSLNYVGCTLVGAPGGSALQLRISTDGSTFTKIGSPLSADTPALWLLDDTANVVAVRLEVFGLTTGYVANIMAGTRTELQRRVYVGHTPIKYGRETTSLRGVAENGSFMGTIIRRRTLGTSISVDNVTPDYYRETLDPMFVALQEQPHYFAWRVWIADPAWITDENGKAITDEDGVKLHDTKASPRDEVAYAWADPDPNMGNSRPNGMVQASWSLSGINGNQS